MKELQITVKAQTEKDFKQAVDYALYELSLGVQDNKIDLVANDGTLSIHLDYKVFGDL